MRVRRLIPNRVLAVMRENPGVAEFGVDSFVAPCIRGVSLQLVIFSITFLPPQHRRMHIVHRSAALIRVLRSRRKKH